MNLLNIGNNNNFQFLNKREKSISKMIHLINNKTDNNNQNKNNMNNNNMNNNNMNNNNINNNNINSNNLIKNKFYKSNNKSININQQKSFNVEMNNINNNIKKMNLKKCPHTIGLKNLGHSSYMNASLQCLFNIKFLSKKLIDSNLTLNPNTQKLTYAYTNLLLELNNTTSKYINPSIFKSNIEELNHLFQRNEPSDARELIIFIIKRLHLELKPPKNNKNQLNFPPKELIYSVDKLSLKKFLNDLDSNKSFIIDFFYGITKIEEKCDKCQRNKYIYKVFNMLNFILKEIKDDKIRNLGNIYYDGIDIFDAF